MQPLRTSSTSAAATRGDGPTRRLVLPLLESIDGLAHLFTVKGSMPSEALREEAGLDLPLRTLRQVHGAVVRTVEPAAASAESTDPPEGDALLTSHRGLALGVFVADCAPILVCDATTGALAAVHAGWRGTVAGVLRAALASLRDRFGARPADLRVAIGPCIGPCCFEVGDEVVASLLSADPGARTCVRVGARPRIDLVEANRRQALEAGVPAGRIEAAGLCTMCRGDLLESYRRGRGRAGRMAGIIAWRP